MKVYTTAEEVASSERSVAIGAFDGVHVGHREVIACARSWAAAHGVQAAVVTFEPHPLEILHPEKAPKVITPLPIKRELIAETGVDELIVLPFDSHLAALSAEQFCDRILARALTVRHVSVGKNFHFGHGAKGNYRLLMREGEHLGFSVDAVDLIQSNGGAVSSSRIRKLVAAGEVATAARLLTKPFVLEGEVVHGDGRGRDLGVPTANVLPPANALLPANGIYAARGTCAFVGDVPAAVSIGVRPTFEPARVPIVEAYLLDTDEDLYGTTLRLSFIEHLREERKFDSENELIEQMHRDIEQVRRVGA